MIDPPKQPRPLSAHRAKYGLVASLVAFMQIVLVNPTYGLMRPIIPDAWWPGIMLFSGIEILILAPVGFILSCIALMGVTSHGRKGILAPGLTGIIVSLLAGVPLSYGYLQRDAQIKAAARAPLQAPSRASVTIATGPQLAATPQGAVASKAAGIFVPALSRVDMVHDPKREILYITAGDSVLRYQLGSRTFLEPVTLGGDLLGIDISTDNDLLAVADASGNNNSIWIHLVDLNTGTNARVTIRTQLAESGTYSVAFGADGRVWVSSSLRGSGFLPLRTYDPATRSVIQIGDVSQDTMLAASADRKMIAYAQGNVSPGSYGNLGYRATQLLHPLRAESFLYEIGINRDGTQMAVPTFRNVVISGSAVQNLDEKGIIGVAYHPTRDFVFFAQSGTSLIAAYETVNFQRVKEMDFGTNFEWTGTHAFQSGRLRLSRDGVFVFCTVNGGIRYAGTGL